LAESRQAIGPKIVEGLLTFDFVTGAQGINWSFADTWINPNA
jgi:hypothetical protein